MPSFLTNLKITGLKPGNPPEAVMAAAVEALGTLHHVESNQLNLAGGVPQLNLRFLVEPTEYHGENQQARESAAMMRDAVERVALTGSLSILRRNRGRWAPVWADYCVGPELLCGPQVKSFTCSAIQMFTFVFAL